MGTVKPVITPHGLSKVKVPMVWVIFPRLFGSAIFRLN